MNKDDIGSFGGEAQRRTPVSRERTEATNRNPAEANSGKYAGKYATNRNAQQPVRRRRRRRRRRLNPRFVLLVSVLVLILLVLISMCSRSCTGKSKLTGKWDLDGTTVYEFYGKGKGALILLTAEYEFSYTIQDDTVYIDFTDDRALDSKYTFRVEKDMLFLTGGPGDIQADYVLVRKK